MCCFELTAASKGFWSVRVLLGGSLGGAVSICAGADVVDPWAACLTGAISGAFYFFGARLLLKLGIDDPVEAVPVHLGCGMWGLLARALFANRSALPSGGSAVRGVFFDGFSANSMDFFGWQLLGGIVIALYSCTFAVVACLLLKRHGWLRLLPEEEKLGLDILFHGVEAHMRTLDDLEGFRKLTRRQRNSMVASESSAGTSIRRKDSVRDSGTSQVKQRFLSTVSL